jgi:hypothetical protein
MYNFGISCAQNKIFLIFQFIIVDAHNCYGSLFSFAHFLTDFSSSVETQLWLLIHLDKSTVIVSALCLYNKKIRPSTLHPDVRLMYFRTAYIGIAPYPLIQYLRFTAA